MHATLKPCTTYAEAMFATAYRPDLFERIQQVVDVEAPLHIEDLARSVAACFGWERVTHRVRTLFVEALQDLEGRGLLKTKGDFVWPSGTDSPDLARIRVPAPGDEERDLAHIPLEELATAARWHLSQALSIPYRDLARATARTFGIQSLGKRVDERMREVIETLVSQGAARLEDDRVEWLGS